MKKLIMVPIALSLLGGFLFLSSCSKKSDPIPLVAKAGDDQTATVLTTVSLDGSASTGPGTVLYEWQYIGGLTETQISLQNKTTAKATFVPPINGIYTFNLNITSGNQFSTDQVVVTVSGVLTLSGTLSSNMALQDIELDPTKPDYKLTADLIIPTGITISAPSTPGNIIIDAADNTGIQIQGGSLTGSIFTFSSTNGWKGILMSSGSLSLATCKILKGGKSLFTGQTEAAAITVTGGTLTVNGGTTFTGSTGYDILISSASVSSQIVGTTFSSTRPIKAPISLLSTISANNYGTYDFITLTTPGAGTTVAATTSFAFLQGTKYYIDGDFTAGSLVTATGSPTIYMKPGTGIVVSAGFTAQGATFDGFDGVNAGAPWKGIALGGSSSAVSISSSFIKNAGSAVFSTGSFTSTQKAAIYFYGGAGTVSGTEISNSLGYGVFMDSPGSPTYLTLATNTFKNSALAHISAPVNIIHQIFGPSVVTSSNTFTGTTAAVEIPSFSISTSPIGIWASLGGTNFYQFLSSVTQQNTTWTLSPGVNLKFKSGKQLDITQTSSNKLIAIGTATNPITFDSESGAPGGWAGIALENLFNLEYCIIKNGGQSAVFLGGTSPATELANVVFSSTVTLPPNTFKNNTISGSGGYGTLIESGKQDPQPLLAANANTYSSNNLGTSIKKP